MRSHTQPLYVQTYGPIGMHMQVGQQQTSTYVYTTEIENSQTLNLGLTQHILYKI